MKLEEFGVYTDAMKMSEEIWNIVMKWDYFAKDTIGKQLVRSADSATANLSEGLGRYHYKEAKHFSYYSRGSLFETKTWITKANSRNLITGEQYADLIKQINNIGVRLNNYIKSIGKTKK